jgi:putative flippase GtrA
VDDSSVQTSVDPSDARPVIGPASASTRLQVARFATVGGSGYAVNIIVFAALTRSLDAAPVVAATAAFAAAVTSNYLLNRAWTFTGTSAGFCAGGRRFLLISLGGLGIGLVLLAGFVELGAPKLVAQSAAIALVTPVNFVGSRWYAFRAASTDGMNGASRRRFYQYPAGALAAVLAILVVSPSVAVVAWLKPMQSHGRGQLAGGLREPVSLADVNRSLALADGYIGGLDRTVPGGAVMAEMYTVPLRVYRPRTRSWTLLGEDHRTSCAFVCTPTTLVDAGNQDYAGESFVARFQTDGVSDSPRLAVHVAWGRPGAPSILQIRLAAFDDRHGEAIVFLGGRKVGVATRAAVGRTWLVVVPANDRGELASLRYTVRHASQSGLEYYRYQGSQGRSDALERSIRRLGYRPEFDLRAPIWGRGSQFGVGLVYSTGSSGGIYHDCTGPSSPAGATSADAYLYRSKVCDVPRRLYVHLTASDTLAQAAQALLALKRFGSPRASYTDANGRSTTAQATARRLEALFRSNGAGLPECSPVACATLASGIRTFHFGALEALLAYRYGDATSRTYADASAAAALRAQVPSTGVVSTADGRFLRPTAVGSYYLNWSHEFIFAASNSLIDGLQARFTHSLDAPQEYRGVSPSNAETTLDAYAFLTLYRCARFGVGCQRAPSVVATSNTPRATAAASAKARSPLPTPSLEHRNHD